MTWGTQHRYSSDAVLLVVSEETGRISVAVGGKLEPVPRENLSARLASLLSAPAAPPAQKPAPSRMPRSAA